MKENNIQKQDSNLKSLQVFIDKHGNSNTIICYFFPNRRVKIYKLFEQTQDISEWGVVANLLPLIKESLNPKYGVLVSDSMKAKFFVCGNTIEQVFENLNTKIKYKDRKGMYKMKYLLGGIAQKENLEESNIGEFYKETVKDVENAILKHRLSFLLIFCPASNHKVIKSMLSTMEAEKTKYISRDIAKLSSHEIFELSEHQIKKLKTEFLTTQIKSIYESNFPINKTATERSEIVNLLNLSRISQIFIGKLEKKSPGKICIKCHKLYSKQITKCEFCNDNLVVVENLEKNLIQKAYIEGVDIKFVSEDIALPFNKSMLAIKRY